jgi:hypothetical protein
MISGTPSSVAQAQAQSPARNDRPVTAAATDPARTTDGVAKSR